MVFVYRKFSNRKLKFSNRKLVELLRSNDKWHRQTALRLLGDRKDASILPYLKKIISEEKGQVALEALWAVNLCGQQILNCKSQI